MREFKFGNIKIDFLFNGEVFSINVTKAGTGMARVGELLTEAASKPDSVERSIKEVLELLDDMLGKGSIDKLFADREISISDVCDLVTFISTEINEYGKSKKQELVKLMEEAREA